MEWTPITFDELSFEILKGEKEMSQELLKFWNIIKIKPIKWIEDEYGKEGNGFWVVGIYNNLVIYYNDIEEGFNISDFKKGGKIENYYAEQDPLQFAIFKLYKSQK